MNPEDQVRLRHSCEQLGAFLEEMSPVLAQYYRALEREGIPPEVIAPMMVHMQTRIFANIFNRTDERRST